MKKLIDVPVTPDEAIQVLVESNLDLAEAIRQAYSDDIERPFVLMQIAIKEISENMDSQNEKIKLTNKEYEEQIERLQRHLKDRGRRCLEFQTWY